MEDPKCSQKRQEDDLPVRRDLGKPGLLSYIWDAFDKPPEERRLVLKLDAGILCFGSIGYFLKSVDQYNILNAFVSGMKEDLHLYQNQLNYMQTAWAVGYMVGQIPSNIILTRTRPQYWIPSLEVFWSILILSLSKCNAAYQFYVIRFFVGLTESGYYPGIQHVLGSWYRRDELGKRGCVFQVCSAVGQMVSGYIMAGVIHLGGKAGYKSWQWSFVINGTIALLVALAGYFMLPDVPEITKSWYLTPKEVALARRRMELECRQPRGKYSKEKLKRIFSSWHVYLVTILYMTFNNGITYGQPIFQQYLRHSTHPKYTVSQINHYSTATPAMQLVAIVICSWMSDTVLRGKRWPFVIIAGIINLICYISLAIWDIPTWWKWTCLIGAGASYGVGGLIMTWANEICSADSEERAIAIAAMNEFAYIVQIWLPLLVWQQVDAPRYFKGYITVSCMSAAMLVICLIVRVLHEREIAVMEQQLFSQQHGEREDEQGLRVTCKGSVPEFSISRSSTSSTTRSMSSGLEGTVSIRGVVIEMREF
ncbi:hypothetical protein VTN49DRAFT_8000 [Thermomyces lanuginosus]|uniref:uncharacterized protein n=1 Tax=Thermomyces lanuginosus TaxID=5541 RepID=UPI0037441CC9